MVNLKRILENIRNWIWKFSGEDCKLIEEGAEKGNGIGFIFSVIGCWVIVIIASSMYSSWHFMRNLLTGHELIAGGISLLWALLMTNLYILLLYTITPTLLKSRQKKKNKKGFKIHEPKSDKSIFFRILFVGLLALITAQPLTLGIFENSDSFRLRLNRYVQEYRNEFILLADSSIIMSEKSIYRDIERKISLSRPDGRNNATEPLILDLLSGKLQSDSNFLNEGLALYHKLELAKQSRLQERIIDSLDMELSFIINKEVIDDQNFVQNLSSIMISQNSSYIRFSKELDAFLSLIVTKNAQYDKLDQLLSISNFYVRKIQIINKYYPLAWIINIIVIGVFLFPIWMKYNIRNKYNYYPSKEKLENDFVKREYDIFKTQYSDVIYRNWQIRTTFFEAFIDPPFNNHLKEKGQLTCKKEDDLIKEFYDLKGEQDAEWEKTHESHYVEYLDV
jgi:hypothetical protein